MSKKNKWLELGLLIKNTTDRNGNPIPVKDQKTTFKLSDEAYKALTDAGFNISQYGVLTNPVDEVERLIKNGHVEEGKIEQRRQTAKDSASWLRYKIQLPPPKQAQE